MKLLKFKNLLKYYRLKICYPYFRTSCSGSSLGSFIEQEESIQFYEENYANKIYGIIDSKLILTFGLDHVYHLVVLIFINSFATSLISCTFTRQFPLLENSKEYFFKKKEHHFLFYHSR
jgi:cytochrome c biogenesis protein ResB